MNPDLVNILLSPDASKLDKIERIIGEKSDFARDQFDDPLRDTMRRKPMQPEGWRGFFDKTSRGR